ncbi:MAG: addiction module toxin, HicA family [Candidatus Parabeggiatoa sp. nov. 2]|nr:MAG: hypothetical protein B6247_04205 [Beggiatoa sp. 4572_84]RKZ60034.1 MAG: addiction module toxin, HicA family [Gammaproteobacteria bacterium]
MKRRKLIHHVEAYGGEFFREGRNHIIYVNRATQKATSIPRHKDFRAINDFVFCKMKVWPLSRSFF